MKYNGFTNVGSMYQAKCKANELPIKFVKVKVGNGLLEETEDPAKFIDVKSLKKEVVISEKTQIEDAVRLTIQMDNDGVTEGYFPREFGIYVEDEGVEVLYWYVNDGNEASYLPSQSTAPVKLKNHFNIIATTLESLVVNWSGKEFWVDKEYLERKMEVNGNLTTDKINGLAGGYNGTFPLISAIKDNIYLLPATNKFYVCIENYSGSSLTVPNANFEELSVFQNRNKLENLGKITLLYKSVTNKQVIGSISLTDYISNFRIIVLVCGNSLGNPKIDLSYFSYYVETLIFNNEATTDNQSGDYSLIFHTGSGFRTCYFRKNKKEIYLFNPSSNDPTLYAVYGIY
ncbi:phage tail protein [Fusobacterium varium]|uniref:phage tail protein n=1 Tax=Fusobacterium varium TaxID=856 RepID=UPI003F06499C